jgi:hypothetical protein
MPPRASVGKWRICEKPKPEGNWEDRLEGGRIRIGTQTVDTGETATPLLHLAVIGKGVDHDSYIHVFVSFFLLILDLRGIR